MSVRYTLNTAPVGQILYGVYGGYDAAFLTLACCRVKESRGSRTVWGHSLWVEDDEEEKTPAFRTMGWDARMCDDRELVLFRSKHAAFVYMAANISEPEGQKVDADD